MSILLSGNFSSFLDLLKFLPLKLTVNPNIQLANSINTVYTGDTVLGQVSIKILVMDSFFFFTEEEQTNKQTSVLNTFTENPAHRRFELFSILVLTLPQI